METYAFIVAVFAAVFTAGQVLTAWLAIRDSKRQHEANENRARTDRASEDKQVALSIHQELTSLEVQLAKPLVSTDPAQREFLRALFTRCAAKYKLLSDTGSLDTYLAESLRVELDAIAALDPEGTEEAAAVIASKRGDRSRYTWDGSGKLSKLALIQKIALTYAASTALGYDDFTKRFAAELTEALGDRKVDPDKFLVALGDADRAHTRAAEQVGTVVLDAEEYVVRHALGLSDTRNYGARIQIPVIDHFRGQFPIADAS